ncbi:MAG: hypothetical protein ABI867_13900 [Kofleriaceae bacterium]
MRSSLVVLVLLGGTATAEPCDNDGVAVSMFSSRMLVEPSPSGTSLGVDLSARTISVAWGRCRGTRHRIEVSAFEAPDYGDPDSRFFHFGTYRLQWHDDDWSAYAGLTAVTLWAGDVRFATPVLGFRAWPGRDVTVALELESAGVFVAAYAGTARRIRDDLALEASAAWPASAAKRIELRARVRDYRIDDMRGVRDVTALGGVGLAYVVRSGMRGFPGFLGAGVRAREGEPTQLVMVVELALGVANY